MKKLIKGSDTGYSVVDSGEGWGYYVFITDEKANECRNYEYSAGCGTIEDVEKEQEKAHKAWLEERFKVLADLKYLMEEADDDDTKDALKRTIDFIMKGEM